MQYDKWRDTEHNIGDLLSNEEHPRIFVKSEVYDRSQIAQVLNFVWELFDDRGDKLLLFVLIHFSVMAVVNLNFLTAGFPQLSDYVVQFLVYLEDPTRLVLCTFLVIWKVNDLFFSLLDKITVCLGAILISFSYAFFRKVIGELLEVNNLLLSAEILRKIGSNQFLKVRCSFGFLVIIQEELTAFFNHFSMRV